MIQFDWDRLKRLGSNKAIILAISSVAWPEKVPSKTQILINAHYWKDYSGISFLLNPIPLLSRKYELPNKTIVEYIMLASKRSLSEYLLTGTKTLDTRLAPYIPTDNQLLTITKNEVHFKYE